MKPLPVYLISLLPAALFAQGTLTPPGAPAPTMITLSQVEPRTPISSLPFTIANRGSYYVVSNLTGGAGLDGITIQTNDVTVDLGGFTVAGVSNSLAGIRVSGARTNIVVRHGIVRGWGQGGIACGTAANSRLEGLAASHNLGTGIGVGTGGLIASCVAEANGSSGIAAGGGSTVRDCVATANVLNGFVMQAGCVVLSCSASSNVATGIGVGAGSSVRTCAAMGNGSGISAGQYGTVADSAVSFSSSGDGIFISLGSTVRHCVSGNNFGDGIQGGDDCRVEANECSFNGTDGASYGIHITGSFSRIEGNQCVDNSGSRNLKLDIGSGSLVIRNTVNGGGATSFNVPAGNLMGPLLGTAAAVLTNSNPHANYAY